tara:strand:+ start:379 stop:1125 length:747 start_codon:yes stop_codon:yes gene_type:complete
MHDGRPHWVRAVAEDWAICTGAPWEGGEPTEVHVPSAALVAPVAPSKVLCIGRNYAAHAAELGNEVPTTPLIFLKPPSAIIGPGQPIELPPASERVEHEAELGVVLGAAVPRDATPDEAAAAIFGFTCVNDVTARDIQRAENKFTRAKGFDTFCPVGPWITTGLDPRDLEVRCVVSGQERQRGRTRQMIFDVPTIVAFLSTVMMLLPGDLVATGTPEGVGPLTDGDSVTVTVEGVGALTSPVVRRAAR